MKFKHLDNHQKILYENTLLHPSPCAEATWHIPRASKDTLLSESNGASLPPISGTALSSFCHLV